MCIQLQSHELCNFSFTRSTLNKCHLRIHHSIYRTAISAVVSRVELELKMFLLSGGGKPDFYDTHALLLKVS